MIFRDILQLVTSKETHQTGSRKLLYFPICASKTLKFGYATHSHWSLEFHFAEGNVICWASRVTQLTVGTPGALLDLTGVLAYSQMQLCGVCMCKQWGPACAHTVYKSKPRFGEVDHHWISAYHKNVLISTWSLVCMGYIYIGVYTHPHTRTHIHTHVPAHMNTNTYTQTMLSRMLCPLVIVKGSWSLVFLPAGLLFRWSPR